MQLPTTSTTQPDILSNAADLSVLQEAALTAGRQAVTTGQATPDWKQPDDRGRVRSFAPEEGSYATSVMIPGMCMH